MRRINYKSDIPPLLLSLKVDEKQITVPDCDFIVRFYIDGYEGRHYDCSHIGGVWSNCEPSEDGTKLVCYINNQRLGIGELCAEFHYIRPERRYSDGSQKSVVIIGSTELGVELVEDNGDAVTEASIDVTLPFIYRTAYDIARDHGYTGTAEDFYGALASVVGIAEAEKKRVTAEITRNANEQERIENEENRLNAENDRVNAEAQRVRNEAIRRDAESDRVEQEEDRKSKFEEITGFIATVRANEGNRESNERERQANEDTRITEEAKRVEAEKKRATAEITRNANEQERIENEENRLNAENDRVNAEAQRVRNEAIRRDAESDRVEQEEDRKSKFEEITGFIATVRANEGNRESNERERQANEDTRITDEAKRVEAEKKRATEFEQQKLDLAGKIDRSGDKMGGDLIFTDNAGVSFRTSDGGAHSMFNDTDDVAKFTSDNGYTFEFKQNETPSKNSSAVVVSKNLYNALDMTLESMGRALDGDAMYRAEAGDKIFNPDNCKIQIYNSTIDGFEDLCEPIDGKLYANKLTGYIYRWEPKANKMVFVGGVKAYTKEESDSRFAKLDDATQRVKVNELEANNSVTTKSMWIGDEGLLLGGDGNGHLTVEQDEVITDVTLNEKLATKADDVAYGVEWNNGQPTGDMQETTIKEATKNTTIATLFLGQSCNTLESEVEKKADKTELDTKVDKTDIVQSTGTSTTAVMSQKAVSDALSNVYTKAESDARYLRGEVLYEDYYYPNMGETTDKVKFSDSTEILQPTKFIGEYTDESGQKYNCVFECDSFPDWFDYAERECYPYGNGISTAVPFFKNYTIDNGELIYNFDSMQNINISKKLPHFTNNVGLKKIDDNHFNLYTAKNSVIEFTAFDRANVDCSLFAFSPVTYNQIYDVDDCKLVRITFTGNIKPPSRYSSLLNGSCDVGLIGYTSRQVLYGDEYVEIEIDKNNNRWRQVKSGYSMFYRSSHLQNWSANKPESYESECHCLWSNIPNGTVQKICMINNKVCYSFTNFSNPSTLLLMCCKIKIEKLA